MAIGISVSIDLFIYCKIEYTECFDSHIQDQERLPPIPWRKGDEERKQEADKVSFGEAQRKIDYNRDQPCHDGCLRVWLHS